MNGEVRIATRKSPLALWQAEHVAARLVAAHAGLSVRLLPMVTEGDRIQGSLARVGGKGLFIKELETAILDGRADIAVHSMKDLPAELPQGLVIGAALERADPRDAFVSVQHTTFAALPRGANVGTSSLRRQSQLHHARPDLRSPCCDGMSRQGFASSMPASSMPSCSRPPALTARAAARIRERLSPDQMLPAVGRA